MGARRKSITATTYAQIDLLHSLPEAIQNRELARSASRTWESIANVYRDERDSLVASLEATKPCEPCQRDEHDNCTGDCSSMCCALAAAERERDSALADLAALRARVEAAVTRCQRTISAWNTNHDAVSDFRCEEASDLLAILAPPEAPTDKGET